MKRLLLFLVSIIFFLSSKSQEIKDCDICKYKTAFNYLICDSISWEGSVVQLNNTFVSDSITSIDFVYFWNELKKENESDEECYSRISKLRENRKHKPIYSLSLSNIFHDKIDNPSFIVFFSKAEDNRLFCEVLPLNKHKILSYSQNTYFNESYIYMFVFQDNDLMKKVTKKKIAYN